MLALYVIEDFMRHSNTKTLYFFCDSTARNQEVHGLDVLLSLLWQTLNPTDLPPVLLSAFRAQGDALFSQQSFPMLLSILKQMLVQHSDVRVNCVIDGIDECETNSMQQLLKMLVGLVSKPESESDSDSTSNSSTPSITAGGEPHGDAKRISLMLFSRSEDAHRFDYIISDLERVNLQTRYEARIKHDVQKLLHSGVKKLAKRKEWSAELKTKVEAKLLDRSEGIFLWVSFVLRDLTVQPNAEVLTTIEKTPKGLHQLYDDILRRIKIVSSRVGRTALRWALGSQRRLRLEEMADVLDIRDCDSENAKQNVRDAIDLSYGFLQVYDVADGAHEIGVCHASVTEFLRSTAKEDEFLEIDSIDYDISSGCMNYIERVLLSDDARRAIFEIYHYLYEVQQLQNLTNGNNSSSMESWLLNRLTTPSWSLPGSSDSICTIVSDTELVSRLVPGYALVWYAVKWWPTHIRRSGLKAQSLLSPSRPILDWFRHNSKNNGWSDEDEASGRDADLLRHTYARNGHGPNSGRMPITRAEINLCRLGRDWWETFKNLDNHNVFPIAPFSILHLSARLNLGYLTDTILTQSDGFDVPIDEMVNSRDGFGSTPLMLSAQTGDIASLRLLLEYGAQADLRDHFGNTALHYAALSDHLDCVSALMDAGARTDCVNDDDQSPMSLAITIGAIDVITALASSDPALNPSPQPGRIPKLPLSYAAMRGNYGAVKILLDSGADPHRCDMNGDTALHNLARSSFDFGGKKVTPLNITQNRGLGDIVRVLLAYGNDRTCRNARGQTPLMLAAAWANEQVVDALLENADATYVNLEDEEGVTALLAACYQAEYMRLYRDEGKAKAAFDDDDARNKKVKRRGSLTHMTAGISLGMFVWQRRYQGGNVDAELVNAPPQVVAIYTNVVNRLLRAGANVFAAVHGLNALHLALLQPYGLSEVAQLIMEIAPRLATTLGPFGQPVHMAAANGCSLALLRLKERGVDFSAKDTDGRSVLQHAILGACNQTREPPDRASTAAMNTELIIKVMSSNVNVRNIINSEHLVHLAMSCQHRQPFLRQLLEQEPDLLLEDSNGNIPLHYAAAHFSGLESVKALLDCAELSQKHRSLDQQTREGLNAVLLAVFNGNVEAVQVLTEHMTDDSLVKTIDIAYYRLGVFHDFDPSRVRSMHPVLLLQQLSEFLGRKSGQPDESTPPLRSRAWGFGIRNCTVHSHDRDGRGWRDEQVEQDSAPTNDASYEMEASLGAQSIQNFGLFPDQERITHSAQSCRWRSECCEFHSQACFSKPHGLSLPD